jgi:hypothetical protein
MRDVNSLACGEQRGVNWEVGMMVAQAEEGREGGGGRVSRCFLPGGTAAVLAGDFSFERQRDLD